ncbi:hypothetical protein NQ317_019838 [Molorchus minor]|uniref:Uncharacterized protein n=1 Tax=Molorchus minor TaxID=1323400 RepID=A0ABQ9J9R6_9CUCU|nr:hypothetical protein NQ317_019838 [Molorchus minor]
MWLVVKFIDEDSVEAIPKMWYIKTSKECYWPSERKREKVRAMIKRKEYPKSDWSTFKVHILGEYENFPLAEQKANRARDSDNLNSSQNEDNRGRGHRISKKSFKFTGSSSDESRDYSSDSELTFPEFGMLYMYNKLFYNGYIQQKGDCFKKVMVDNRFVSAAIY